MNTVHSNCLITGGGGFIGLHLAHNLKQRGFSVTALDIRDVAPELRQGIGFIQADVCDEELMKRIIPGFHTVFHLGALLGVKRSMSAPVEMIHNNLSGTVSVLKAAMVNKSKVVFASTSEVYGKAEPPFGEDGDLVFGTPSKLRWSYALAKSLEEALCLGYGLQGLPVTIVRYFNIYGPMQKEGMYGGVVPRFIKAAIAGKEIPVYGDGLQTRSFTFVDDAVEMTIRAAFGAGTRQQIVNIGTDNEISVLELATIVKRLSQSESPIVHVPFEQVYPHGFEEISRRLPSTKKSERLLGYRAETPLENGLDVTIRWYRQWHRQNQTEGGQI